MLRYAYVCALSSVGKSIRLISGRPWVQVPQGAPVEGIMNED